jgi:hypothetical protein
MRTTRIFSTKVIQLGFLFGIVWLTHCHARQTAVNQPKVALNLTPTHAPITSASASTHPSPSSVVPPPAKPPKAGKKEELVEHPPLGIPERIRLFEKGTCAYWKNGERECWGFMPDYSFPRHPKDLKQFVGRYCYLSNSGELKDLFTTKEQEEQYRLPCPNWKDIVSVSSTNEYVCVLQEKGVVHCGRDLDAFNKNHEKFTFARHTNKTKPSTKVTTTSWGTYCLLSQNGKLGCWGENLGGGTLHSKCYPLSEPYWVPQFSNLKSLAVDENQITVFRSTGQGYTWSDTPKVDYKHWMAGTGQVIPYPQKDYQYCMPNGKNQTVPETIKSKLPNPKVITEKMAGMVSHTCVWIDSKRIVQCSGSNFYGQLGNGEVLGMDPKFRDSSSSDLDIQPNTSLIPHAKAYQKNKTVLWLKKTP